MSLNHVLLGLLQREPLTGYEMKKILQSTPFMYWSGNNNQIYKALAELLDEGFVTKEVQHQDGSPSKNIYTLTGEGQCEFNNWLLSTADAPVFKNQFLIKLALSDSLNRSDLQKMLRSYENVVKMEAVLSKKELDKCYFSEEGHLQKPLMDLIQENVTTLYSSELAWIDRIKEYAAGLPDEERTVDNKIVQEGNKTEEFTMNYQIIENQGKPYLYFTGTDTLFQREQDAVDIISLCASCDAKSIILDGNALSDDFAKLRTGLAGAVLQKFENYNIRAAVVVKEEQDFPKRFQEMALEHSRGNTFRIFKSLEEAKNWLV